MKIRISTGVTTRLSASLNRSSEMSINVFPHYISEIKHLRFGNVNKVIIANLKINSLPHKSDQSRPNKSDQSRPNKSDQSIPNKTDQSRPNKSDQSRPNKSVQSRPNQSDQSREIVLKYAKFLLISETKLDDTFLTSVFSDWIFCVL